MLDLLTIVSRDYFTNSLYINSHYSDSSIHAIYVAKSCVEYVQSF